ncbi:MAG: molybdopterin-dependent oxidoreductase [Chloroflexota bacterium]
MTRASLPAQTGFLAGVLSAVFMILIMFGLRLTTTTPSVLELLADGILGVLPAAYFESLLDSMRQIAKPVMYAIMLIGQLIVGGAIGQWYARHRRRHRVLLMVLVLWAAFGLLLFPVLGLGIFGSTARGDTMGIAISSLIAFLGFACLLLMLTDQLKPAESSPESVDRRRFFSWVAGASGSVVVAIAGWRLGLSSPQQVNTKDAVFPVDELRDEALRHGSAPAVTDATFGVSGLPREVTPTADFFTVSKNLSFLDPVIDPKTWQLRVDGLVEQPLLLTFDDVSRLPSVTDFYTLQCISNDIGGDLIGNAQWKGFRLADILALARFKPGAIKVVFHCSDDYQVSISPDRATHPDTLAAYEMNGAPLTKEHGAPLRIVVPGVYGMMNAKWVRRIEIVNHDHKGYWQAKGWSDVATYKTSTRIDVPRNRPTVPAGQIVVGGIAFAGDRGVSAVEVSFDKGKTWQPAELKPPLSHNAWGLWRYSWHAEPGSYTLHARAIDGSGTIQPAEVRGPLPDGASGLHELGIKVTAEVKSKAV